MLGKVEIVTEDMVRTMMKGVKDPDVLAVLERFLHHIKIGNTILKNDRDEFQLKLKEDVPQA